MGYGKRFIVFGFDTYYPSGGWKDYRGEFATELEALQFALTLREENRQVVDRETGEVQTYSPPV